MSNGNTAPVPPSTLKKATCKLRKHKTKKTAYVCASGPYSMQTLHLSSPNTAVFKVGKERGRYKEPSEDELKNNISLYGKLIWEVVNDTSN